MHLHRHFPVFILFGVVMLLSLLASSVVFAAVVTFSNTGSIAIPTSGTSGLANPYPSNLVVSGMDTVLTDVNVTISGYSHTFPDDVDVLLVGPQGQKIMLMSDVGGSLDVVGVNLTFDQAAGSSLPDSAQIVSGTYLPTNIGAGDPFAAPAPAAPHGSSLNDFNGTDPNGTWSLYVVDDLGGDVGSFSGGWSVTIDAAPAGDAPTITSAASATGAVGVAFTHTFTATGDPAPTLSYSAENLPPGVTRSGNVLSGTPTEEGTFSLTATASNGVTPDAVQTFTLTVGPNTVPTPPPTPLCETHNFDEGGIVRSSTADAFGYAVNCRVLYQNGAPTQWLGGDLYNAGSIGVQGVLDLGVEQAVDIFSPVGQNSFQGGAVFCLKGTGTLIWLAASQMPRHAEIIGSYTVPEFPGFTCATLFEPGTLVLVRETPR